MPVRARSIRHSGLFGLGVAALLLAGCGGAAGDGGPGATAPRKGLHFLVPAPISDTILAVYARAVVVELHDDNGKPIAGVPVTISSRMVDAPQAFAALLATLPLPVGATRPTQVVTTDGSGRAQLFMRLGYRAGTGFVVADAGGGRRDSLVVTMSPGQPITLAITPLDTAILVGGTIQPTVVARDQGDNDVGRPIDLSVTSPAITLAAGKVSGAAIGRAAVVASLGALRDTTWISVVPTATFAFYASPTLGGQEYGVYLLDSDGSNGKFLYRDPSQLFAMVGSGAWPAWSPNGKQIAFVGSVNATTLGLTVLKILDAAGGAPRDLVSGGVPVSDLYGPQFDALGRVHFTRGEFGSQLTVWRVPAAGGTTVQESSAVTAGMEAGPSPNPAGDAVAYQTNLSTGSLGFTLRILDPATGTVQKLDVPGSSPRWSPAGDRIAYLDATGRLQFMTPAGVPIASPSAGVAFVPGFSWSPDGQWIVGVASINGGLQILRVATREILPLALRGPAGQNLLQPSWRPVP